MPAVVSGVTLPCYYAPSQVYQQTCATRDTSPSLAPEGILSTPTGFTDHKRPMSASFGPASNTTRLYGRPRAAQQSMIMRKSYVLLQRTSRPHTTVSAYPTAFSPPQPPQIGAPDPYPYPAVQTLWLQSQPAILSPMRLFAVRFFRMLFWPIMTLFGFIIYRVLSPFGMSQWLTIVLSALIVWLILTLWGYLLGPQGDRPITKRDDDVLNRRADDLTHTTRRRLTDSYQAAANITCEARRFKAQDPTLTDELAIIAALGLRANKLSDIPHLSPRRHKTYGYEVASDWFRLTLEALVDNGVIHDIKGPLRDRNLTTDDVLHNPAFLLDVIRVRSLHEWPTDPF